MTLVTIVPIIMGKLSNWQLLLHKMILTIYQYPSWFILYYTSHQQ